MNLIIACRAIDNMAGGVERQAIALANEMHNRGHKIALFTLDHKGAQAFYEINRDINWYQLDIGNPKQKATPLTRLKRAAATRKIVKEFGADVILGFQQGMFLSMRVFTLGMGITVIGAERESPYRFDHTSEGKKKNLIFQTFRLAKYITVQCESYIQAYPKFLQSKITAIPNPVFEAKPAESNDNAPRQDNTLLCLGRLSYQKNQTVLIDAFAKLADDFKDWKLILVGNGEDEKMLTKQVQKYKLEKQIIFEGAQKNVQKYYRQSDVLCIPSKWEGFPNVLGESLAHSLPSVGYSNCGGVSDLIIDGYNGLLAEGNGNLESLEQALRKIMSDKELRKSMEANALESVQQYKPENIYTIWENFLKKAAQN